MSLVMAISRFVNDKKLNDTKSAVKNNRLKVSRNK